MVVFQDFENYLQKVLDVEVKIRPWKEEKKIPFFLKDLYDFYEISLLGISCLLMVAKEYVEISPATVNKHFKYLQEKRIGLCIYVCAKISSYDRKRLINYRIPFVVPNNQMYLPDLCLDLREHFRQIRKSRKTFSPATLTVIIYALIHKKDQKFIPSELAKELGYSAMTMTRALDELESIGIGEVFQKGRERLLHFIKDRHALWEQAKPFMCSPIRKKILLRCRDMKEIKQLGVISGLTALSAYSMLNQPKLPIYAISMDDWKTLKHSTAINKVFCPEDADIELEIWSYKPKLFMNKKMVDPFSVYLSLQGNKDERVEAALEKFMEQIKW